jgi:metacaspase-1
VRLLLDEQATAEGIVHGLNWMNKCCARDGESTAILFFSGHGLDTASGSYLAAHDARVDDPQEGLIAGEELTNRLQAIKAARLAVFLDCCHSGGIAEIKGPGDGARPRAGSLDERTYERLSTGRGRVLFASSGASEPSSVRPDDRNSLFSSCLLRGLRGEAGKTGSSVLGIFDLFTFVSEEVKRQSLKQQEPVFMAQIRENFPLALRPQLSVDRQDCPQQQDPPRHEESGNKWTPVFHATNFRDLKPKFGK